MSETMNDTRYCYGASCAWHGPISEVKTKNGLPVCPQCGGTLFELESRKQWDGGIEQFVQTKNEPLYPEFIEQGRRDCQSVGPGLEGFERWKKLREFNSKIDECKESLTTIQKINAMADFIDQIDCFGRRFLVWFTGYPVDDQVYLPFAEAIDTAYEKWQERTNEGNTKPSR